MRIKLLLLSGTLFLCVNYNTAHAQIEKFKAAYIYNFTQQMKWPDKQNSGEFIIGILVKNQALADELKSATAKRTVGSQSIKIEEYKSVDEIQQCHILFVPDQQSGLLKRAVSKLGNSPTVVITENLSHDPSESTINLHVEDGRLTFSINKDNANLKKIIIGEKLLALAKSRT